MADKRAAPAAEEQWYRRETPEEAARGLLDECDRAIQENEYRRTEARVFGGLHEGCNLTSFCDRGTDYRDDQVFPDFDIPVVRNTCRSIVQTALSKLTAQDSPLPQFMSNGGDWETRTKAIRLDRLVTAEYDQAQGAFANLHELFRHGANLAMAATGSFAVFYFATPEGMVAELDDTLTLGLEKSGRHGRIVSLVRTAWYSAEELIARFPDYEDEILENEDHILDGAESLDCAAQFAPERAVKVCQGWRSQLGKKSSGRFLMVLKDGTILHDDQKFSRREPPCVFWHYERSLFGHWGVSLTRSIYNQCLRINEIINDVDQAEKNSPQGLVLHRKGAVAEGELVKTKGWHFVELAGTGSLGDGFTVVQPHKYASQSVDLLLFHESGAHDTSGVSQQHSAARRQPGTTSGKHENYVAALFTERFADTERRLIDMRTVATARCIVWVLGELLTVAKDYKRLYIKGDYVEEIQLADLDLDVERYSISIAPVSEDKQSPQARCERAERAFDAGQMTGAELFSFYQDFDLKRKSDLILAQENWLERQIDMWLHAPFDQIEYQGPIQWMDLQSSAKMVAQALLIARTKRAPDDRIQYFLTFLDEVQAFSDMASAQANTTISAGSVAESGAFPGAGAGPAAGAMPPGGPPPVPPAMAGMGAAPPAA